MGRTYETREVRIELERVCTPAGLVPDLHRTRTPGGWLVFLGKNAGIAFVPDPEGQWLAPEPAAAAPAAPAPAPPPPQPKFEAAPPRPAKKKSAKQRRRRGGDL